MTGVPCLAGIQLFSQFVQGISVVLHKIADNTFHIQHVAITDFNIMIV